MGTLVYLVFGEGVVYSSIPNPPPFLSEKMHVFPLLLNAGICVHSLSLHHPGSRPHNPGPRTLQGSPAQMGQSWGGRNGRLSPSKCCLFLVLLESRRVMVPRTQLCLRVRSVVEFRGLFAHGAGRLSTCAGHPAYCTCRVPFLILPQPRQVPVSVPLYR